MIDAERPSIFAVLSERLRFLSARTSVIAENIANSDTPDYAARDLKKPEFAHRVSTALKVSNPRHIAGAQRLAAARFDVEAAPDPEAALNGNQVSIETQMMKLSETRMDYQLASTIYRKGVELVRLAARGGR